MVATPCKLCGSRLPEIARPARQLRRDRQKCRASAAGRDAPAETLPQRRQLLSAGTLLSASLLLARHAEAEDDAGYSEDEKKFIAVKYLSAFQRKDQKQAIQDVVNQVLGKGLSKADAPAALRAVLHDAGTYDIKDGSGGLNGSIVLDEELSRPENKSLKPYIDKLTPLKQKIDEVTVKEGQGPVSWADLLVLAVKVTAVKEWNSIKIEKSGVGKGEIVSGAFGADFPVKIGRVDATSADPAGRIPSADAPVEEIQKFMTALNNRNPEGKGFFAPKAPFWEKPTFWLWTGAQEDVQAAEQKFGASPAYAGFKKEADQSRNTVTRTNYEVDFITFFTNLANTGAVINPDRYLKPLKINPIRF